MNSKIELSIIVPVYFGARTIEPLVNTLIETLEELISYEILLINDGSTDGSSQVCEELWKKHPDTITFVDLAKNFSEHNAVMAGLNHSTGKYAVIIDDDFQNPPEEIIKLYNRITSTNSDVVFARYVKKQHHWFRNLGSRFNDYVAQIVLNKPKGLYLCSFKILSRYLIDEITKYSGPYPYIDGLILRSTHFIETELVSHNERLEGKSNYTLKKLVSLWSNMFINFSVKPLRIALSMGAFFSVSGFFLALYYIQEKISNPNLPIGWATLIICVLILSGVQLIVMGVIGEFVGRIFLSTNKTPQFVVRKLFKKEVQ